MAAAIPAMGAAITSMTPASPDIASSPPPGAAAVIMEAPRLRLPPPTAATAVTPLGDAVTAATTTTAGAGAAVATVTTHAEADVDADADAASDQDEDAEPPSETLTMDSARAPRRSGGATWAAQVGAVAQQAAERDRSLELDGLALQVRLARLKDRHEAVRRKRARDVRDVPDPRPAQRPMLASREAASPPDGPPLGDETDDEEDDKDDEDDMVWVRQRAF
ncbi:hypothetical protein CAUPRSCDRAFT_12529 [Caulochytrium protostelioides]|uniref:Uncharacterized protein n=1 Tax=Caulochytrium protostelioides TaxID=1555241 RepID=A0A4P9WSY5_9FUNG|nr:hypothetical protein CAUPRSCDRAFT_12529 [Caulochytrium protostelioides]